MTTNVPVGRDAVAPAGDAGSAAARLVWIQLPGPGIDDETARLLEQGVGGVVLFGANIAGPEQLRLLTAELRRRAPGPLRIAIDHEGGHVARIGAPLTRFPSAMAIGATRSEELAYAVALAAGRELAALGIDVNLAPVLDVAADPRNASVGARSFGSSPELVARLGAATVRGYRDAGIAATAKHFPGHGRTPVDPHLDVATVAGGLDALRAIDLPPFRAAIAAGVDLVMATHVAYDGLTEGAPTTVSRAALTDLLRSELGFGGLVLTDAMRMRALADRMPVPRACVAAIDAGADAVMPMEEGPHALDELRAAIGSGLLREARVSDAIGRAMRLEERLSATRNAGHTTLASLPDAAHLELARTVARRSLTLIAGAELLPVRPAASVVVIEFPSRRSSPVEEEDTAASSLGSALARALPRMRHVALDGAYDAEAADRAVAAAADAELVIVATRDAYVRDDDRELVARVAAAGRATMLVALRNPYDVAALAPTTGAVAAYADVPASLEALVDALTGRAGWPGTLPMSLSAAVPVA